MSIGDYNLYPTISKNISSKHLLLCSFEGMEGWKEGGNNEFPSLSFSIYFDYTKLRR